MKIHHTKFVKLILIWPEKLSWRNFLTKTNTTEKICVKWEKFFISRIMRRGSGTNPMCTLCFAHIKVEGLSKHFPSPIGRMIYVRGHYCYTIALANGYETAFMCHASSKPYSKTSLFACIVILLCFRCSEILNLFMENHAKVWRSVS